jgi:hypothetical protein
MQATGRIGTTPSSGSNSRLLIAEHSSGFGPSGREHDSTAYIPRYKTKLVSFTLTQSWRRKWSMLLLPNHFPGSRYFISSTTSGQYDGWARTRSEDTDQSEFLLNLWQRLTCIIISSDFSHIITWIALKPDSRRIRYKFVLSITAILLCWWVDRINRILLT